MSNVDYYAPYVPSKAIEAEVSERVEFIRRTYLHLAGAIMAFVFIEYLLIQSNFALPFLNFAFGSSINWMIILGLFIVVANVADGWAHSGRSVQMQYLGLGLYVTAEAVLFLPLLAIAASYSSPDVIPSAGILTLAVFGGLSAVVFISKKDFSFLRMGLIGASFLALGLIITSLVVGFNLGVVFSIAMVGLASGYVLYDTSKVLHHYRTDQHVAASLALFASIALMFWYILRIFFALGSDD